MSLQCRHCGELVPFDEPIPRDAECANCGSDLRACANCRHFDPSRNNQCTETEADPVADKTRRNFCEYFYFSRGPAAPRGDDTGRRDQARAKLDALFDGGAGAGGRSGAAAPGPAGDRAAEARRKLEALFGRKPPGAT